MISPLLQITSKGIYMALYEYNLVNKLWAFSGKTGPRKSHVSQPLPHLGTVFLEAKKNYPHSCSVT